MNMNQILRPSALQLFLLAVSIAPLSLSMPQDHAFLRERTGQDSNTHTDPTAGPPPPSFFQQLTDLPACSGPGNDDMSNPSQDCLNAQNVSTQGVTYLTRSCNALTVDQRNILNQAVADMKYLSSDARNAMGNQGCSYEQGCTPPPRAEQAMRYYMGDDSVDNLDYRGLIYRK